MKRRFNKKKLAAALIGTAVAFGLVWRFAYTHNQSLRKVDTGRQPAAQVLQTPQEIHGQSTGSSLTKPRNLLTENQTENRMSNKVTADKGKPLWLQNAVVVTMDPSRYKIAIVIDDMGVNRRETRNMMKVHGALTLSFLPYAENVGDFAQEARSKGYEIMVHLPMEPQQESLNPGWNVLMSGMSEQDMKQALEKNLSAFGGYTGVNNHMGSKFTADSHAMETFMTLYKDKGLLFLDSRTIGNSLGEAAALKQNVPSISRDVFLDDDPSAEAVRQSLLKLEKIARKKGYAVAIGHPKPETIAVLNEWLASLHEKKDIQLVPLSNLVQPRLKNPGSYNNKASR